MLATISLSGTLANQRHYNVWGAVRAEQDVDAVNPRGQYVANLGHQTDVESSLIYMRARYYDPATARFVTEDPARDGANWFVYCNNDPVNMMDTSGEDWRIVAAGLFTLLLSLKATISTLYSAMRVCSESFMVGAAGITFLATWFGGLRSAIEGGLGDRFGAGIFFSAGLAGIFFFHGAFLGAAASAASIGPVASVREKAVAVATAYSMTLVLFFGIEGLLSELGIE